jgi:hypothetical protein
MTASLFLPALQLIGVYDGESNQLQEMQECQ